MRYSIFDYPSVFIITVVTILLLGIALLVVGINHLTTPGQIAAIEQLRKDVRRVDIAESEDVIGQVTQWNQKIASYQLYNQMWLTAWTVPDQWDSVQSIEIPPR